jgi:hypothetical protein
MNENGPLPRARQDGLLAETVGEELLLYDQNSHVAHCLSPFAASAWRHCDGERDVAELARLAGASESLVANALHELREKDLLDIEPALKQDTAPGESRREAIGRLARYGAAAAAPLIVSATAATPAMASSVEMECVAKPGTKKSCCKCLDGTCSNGVGKESLKACDEHCEKGHIRLETYSEEGECK